MILPTLILELLCPVGNLIGGEHFRTLELLRSNNSIVNTRLNKGSGVVILDYQCFVDKMMSILGDSSKFLRLRPVDKFNHTTSIETKFQRRFSHRPSLTRLDPLDLYGLVFMGYLKPIRMGFHLDLFHQW